MPWYLIYRNTTSGAQYILVYVIEIFSNILKENIRMWYLSVAFHISKTKKTPGGYFLQYLDAEFFFWASLALLDKEKT